MASSKSKQSVSLQGYLFERVNHHVRSGQRICVALSGGVDSIVLLHAVHQINAQLNADLSAFHVDHGLSSHAHEWAKFCAKVCAEMDIPFEVCRVEVTVNGEGTEAAARTARYAALDRLECDWIFLGHHQDDQAETVVLNLMRGAGVRGAAGMPEQRGRLLRPLLGVSRAEILAYARSHNLEWVEDESNADPCYRRNSLRHGVLPLLEKSFPGAGLSLARAAATFGDTARLLDEVAAADMGEGCRQLRVESLRALSRERGANLLMYYLRLHGLQIPSRATLLEMLRQLVTAGCDSEICFVIGSYQVRRFRQQVWVDPVSMPAAIMAWHGEREMAWAGYLIRTSPVPGAGIDTTKLLGKEVYFSPRKNGGTLQLSENSLRRPLKDLLREAAIPPWRRKTLPMLYAGDELVWVAGIGTDIKYRCKAGAQGVLIEFDGVTW